MARKKSINDIDRQYERIVKGIVTEYNSKGFNRNSNRSRILINRRKRVDKAGHAYASNIAGHHVVLNGIYNEFPGRDKKVSRSTYMGEKAKGAVSG